MSGHGGIAWEEEWVEVFATLFFVLGFIIAIFLQSAILSYVSIIISGFVAGRWYYLKRFHEPILPMILIIVGFLVGYLIGAVWVSRFLVFLFFLGSWWLSYYLHLRKILVTFKSKLFIK